MAKKIGKIISYSGGKEGQMSRLGLFFLVFGIIGLIASFYVSGHETKTSIYDSWGEKGLSFGWITFGMVILIQGVALFVLLNAGAEVIRLLKKLSGLNFGGEISEPKPIMAFQCSNCGNENLVTKSDFRCLSCGKEFDSVEEK